MDTPRSAGALNEINRINTFFPLMPRLGNRWARLRPWEGRCVAITAHLTTLTAALLRELQLGGGDWVVCAANPATTDMAVVDLLRELEIAVYTGGDLNDRHLATLDHHPDLVADVGFDLLAALLEKRQAQVGEVRAAIEITRSGVDRLRALPTPPPFPVVNLNDGRLKPSVENRRGVGEALWAAVRDITGIHLAGRRILVVGYGPVGEGLASHARAAGAVVEVVELDPIRRLVAHYDGYSTPSLVAGLARCELAVTATARKEAIPLNALQAVRTSVTLVNAGHGGDEIDVAGLKREAERAVQVGPHCTRYRLPGTGWISVLGDGHPLNIVTNSGSPEPVLLQFGALGLALEWLARNPPRGEGEVELPRRVEEDAARLALEALEVG